MSIRTHHPGHRVAGIFLCLFSLTLTSGFSQSLRFQDVTNSAGVSTPNDPNGYGHGVAAGDFNNDGRPDLYVVNYTALNALFRNNGNGSFTNVANSAGVANSTTLEDRGVAAADYDNDGDVDIFVATSAAYAKLLYRNNGNASFSEVAGSAGLSNNGFQGQGVSWGDYNDDGLLDLFLCSYDHAYRLFRQNGNHTFTDVSAAAGLDGATGSVQAVFFDFDLDGDLDIFVGRGLGLPNRLFVNRGNGTFSEASSARNIADPGPHAQGIAVGDYDNDGDLDLYMCDDQGPNRLYRNDEGDFNEVASEAGVQDNSRSLGCHFADFNNDGWLDLYVLNFGTNRLFRNNGDGTFSEDTNGSGADITGRGYGSIVTDYDGDGRLDLYFSHSGLNSNLLRNVTSSSNRWLKITLRGTTSNRNGIGAVVAVTAGGRQQLQQLLAGFAMVSGGSDLTLHFGLGNLNSAERVEVSWPSGQRDVLTNVNANQALTIQEGSYGGGAPDNTPPTISSVLASGLSSASATITWSTNEAADSQVEYGLTTAYGSQSALEAALVTNHSAGLTGLAANTTYHYRVRSRDAAGNLATSGDFTFATNSQSVLLSDNFSTTAIDANKWSRGSNSGNQAAIENGALALRSASSQSGWLATKNAYAGANKIAKVKITSPNDDGDLGISPTINLASTNAIYGQNNWYRFYVYRDNHAGNYLLFAQWKRNGSVDGLDVTHGLNLPNSFWLRLRTDATNIFFEYSANDANWTTVHQEPFALPGYSLSSSFYFEISGNNTPSNGVLRVDDFVLSEALPPSDTQPPVISQVASSNMTTAAATITWNTDEASDSQVEYGATASYGFLSPLHTSLVKPHSITLSNLSTNTTYHFRVRSRDAASNLAQSGDFVFTTAATASSPPVISNVTATNISTTTAQINFTTNRSTTGSAQYDTQTHGVTRVMPLGDSITEGTGSSDDAGYRSGLYDKFSSFGTRFNFVGSLQFGNGIPDADHEGHAGWTANEIQAGLSSFLNQSQPKAVLLHIGTNDITLGDNASTVYNEIVAIVDGVFQYDATIKLYLSTLIPRRDTKQAINDDVNSRLPGLVSARINSGRRMFLVDMSAAFKANNNWSSQWMADNVHPNDAGYDVMAQKWYETYTVTEYDFSASNSVAATTHAIALTNLIPGTVYHYRARARDSANLESASADFTFTTTSSSGPIFSDNFSGSSLDANKWRRGTNSGNLSLVANNVLELRSSGTQTGWIVSRNAYAARNTTVSMKIIQPNDDGNLGMAPAYSLSSTNGIYSQATWYRFYVYRDVASGPYRLYVQWKKNGVVNGLDVTGNAVLNGSFHMRLRCDDTRIHFEFSVDGQAWTAAYSEPFGLSGYTLNSAFYYELAAYRTEVNSILKADDFAINSTTPGTDTQPPVISNVAASNITSTAATIIWNTNEASDSQVEYGTTTNYGSTSPLDASRITNHAINLTALAANATYHYRVKSRDASGNLATSTDFTFTTTGSAGSTMFSDNFNTATLDLNNWTKGSNSGNQASVINNALELRSTGTQTAWVVTKQKYAARNTTVTVKVAQPSSDGDLGMTPAFQASSANGIFNQANWYRFYVYRDVNSGPYRLYAEWSRNGAVDGLDVTGNLNITGTVYLRLRFDSSRIHFEASLNGQGWTDTYNEVFALPGYTLDNTFNYELAAYATSTKGVLTADDFAIATTSAALAKGDGEEALTENIRPTAFELSQNYPNPFHFNTHVKLALPQEAQVQAVIYDVTGREVQQLHQGPMRTGFRVMNWDGTNAMGQHVSSGVYFLRVIFETPAGHKEVLTRQLQLTR